MPLSRRTAGWRTTEETLLPAHLPAPAPAPLMSTQSLGYSVERKKRTSSRQITPFLERNCRPVGEAMGGLLSGSHVHFSTFSSRLLCCKPSCFKLPRLDFSQPAAPFKSATFFFSLLLCFFVCFNFLQTLQNDGGCVFSSSMAPSCHVGATP